MLDMNKVSLVVSICALILAIPLSIVGNLLTPKLRDWYSTTSEKRLQARIAKLNSQLKESEQELDLHRRRVAPISLLVAHSTGRDTLQPFESVRILTDEQHERGGLRIRLGSALFPLFEGALIDAELSGKNRP